MAIDSPTSRTSANVRRSRGTSAEAHSALLANVGSAGSARRPAQNRSRSLRLLQSSVAGQLDRHGRSTCCRTFDVDAQRLHRTTRSARPPYAWSLGRQLAVGARFGDWRSRHPRSSRVVGLVGNPKLYFGEAYNDDLAPSLAARLGWPNSWLARNAMCTSLTDERHEACL